MAQRTSAADDKRPSCPCKKLPLSLSSFTAASYGDVHRLQAKKDKINTPDAGGSTPLHLAAQHGHVMATARLLQVGARVDGGYNQTRDTSSSSSSFTPLHRAAFSGAVETMKLLIDAGADLMARDFSFGDERTPLHKASAGGRYLAVKLLLDCLQEKGGRQQFQNAVEAKDANGLTPLQVAQDLVSRQQEERASVQRWDEVAGGEADWEKCVEILSRVQSKSFAKGQHRPAMRVPSHLRLSSNWSCLDCTDPSGQCRTAAWTRAFRSGLWDQCSVVASTESVPAATNTDLGVEKQEKGVTTGRSERETDPSPRGFLYNASSCPTDSTDASVGQPCRTCGQRTFAFFRNGNGQLVCKACSVLPDS